MQPALKSIARRTPPGSLRAALSLAFNQQKKQQPLLLSLAQTKVNCAKTFPVLHTQQQRRFKSSYSLENYDINFEKYSKLRRPTPLSILVTAIKMKFQMSFIDKRFNFGEFKEGALQVISFFLC